MPAAKPTILQYLSLFWTSINPFIKKWVIPPHAFIGVLDLYHKHLPPPINEWDVFKFFPAWSLLEWGIVVVIVVLIAAADGIFWQRYLIEEAQSQSKPLVNAKGVPYGINKKRGESGLIAPILILVVLVGAYFLVPQDMTRKELAPAAPSQNVTDLKPTKPLEAPTAIYMVCDLVSLPIKISPHSTAHLIPINKKRMKSVKWGFYDVPNHTDLEEQWPKAPMMDQATKKEDNFGVFTWRCEMSNHSMVNVLDIKMSITFDIGVDKITYDVIITPLDAGGTFVFYPINDCPAIVHAVWPNFVELQVLGEENRRKVPLRRTYRNAFEGIMLLFGSTVRLFGDVRCE